MVVGVDPENAGRAGNRINPHPEEDRRSVSKDEGTARASSFETRRFAALLRMRS
jgi:hypothetical protein